MKIFNYLLEIDILRNSPQKVLGDLRCAFEEFWCPKRHPDALLAKTMPWINDYQIMLTAAKSSLPFLLESYGR